MNNRNITILFISIVIAMLGFGIALIFTSGYMLDLNIHYPYLSGALFFMLILLLSLKVNRGMI